MEKSGREKEEGGRKKIEGGREFCVREVPGFGSAKGDSGDQDRKRGPFDIYVQVINYLTREETK